MQKKNKCNTTKNKITKGKIKWKVKNRIKVGFPTANPPQTHSTNITPIYGTADNKLVITVAAQKDICPQGNTYPKNAVAIDNKKILTPLIQVL